ncbi:hypothetical protein C0Q44_07340 [Paenibacillus sp. PCH8]|uniref:hypothetical protein n=1 Tax=Paenibacillus sp. PCH8 TaxID=2066524 RepID=UPI000CFA3241|nr:hypothetical protein [Paenibacillus sp. PCH8]PQP84380.1 hypothetical protein C0Q44_07340 [Paenibacillus sp. PCH8]
MEKPAPLPDTDSEVGLDQASTAPPPVRYVLFPRKGGWSAFPYPDIAALLSLEGDIYYVSSLTQTEDIPAVINVITLPKAEQLLSEPRTVAVITHPYWLMAAASLEPELCIVLLPEPAGDEAESPLWESSIAKLVGIADLVGTSSETRYMKLLFQGIRAIWLGGEDPSPAGTVQKEDLEVPIRDYELFFLHALRQILSGTPDSVTLLQCSVRADFYRQLRAKAGAHETISFLLAAYEYLLEDTRAMNSLQEAFAHAVMNGRSDCVTSHYRFLSAIHARAGQLENALRVYGISAGDEQDRHHYEQLCRWLEAGKINLYERNCCVLTMITGLHCVFWTTLEEKPQDIGNSASIRRQDVWKMRWLWCMQSIFRIMPVARIISSYPELRWLCVESVTGP